MNINRSKGFTLVELLAVFVVLAIIASIVVIIIGGLIRDSKEKAAIVSAKNYINSVNNNILSARLKNFNIPDGTYDVMPNGNICIGSYADDTCDGEELMLELQKGAPTSGQVVISNRKVTSILNVEIKGTTLSYDAIKDTKIVLDDIGLNDFQISKHTNSIEFSFNAVNGTTFKCEYGQTNKYGKFGKINTQKDQCLLEGLRPNTKYYYKISVTNTKGISVVEEGTVTTLPITTPVITVEPSGYSKYKDVSITYEQGDLTNPSYYFYTTSQATSDIAVIDCGGDFEPGECGETTTSALQANKWYKLGESISTVNIRYNINSAIVAKTSDGRVTIGKSQLVITKIDNKAPVVSVKDIKFGEVAKIVLRDEDSGIKYYGVTSTNTEPSLTNTSDGNVINTWYEINPTTNEEVTKNFSGLNAGTYYAWGKDVLGNVTSTVFTVDRIKDIINIEPKTAVYTGNPIPANPATTSGGGTIKYTYYESSNCSGDTINIPINVGDYSVRVELSDSSNYAGTSKCIMHKIIKADPVITVNPTMVVAPKNNTATITVKSNTSGTFKFTSGNTSIVTTSNNITASANQTYTSTLTSHNEGTTRVTVNFTPTDLRNFNTASKTIDVRISDTLIIPTTEANCKPDLVYNGANQVLTNDVSSIIYTNNIGKNAGSYTVTATIDPSTSYMWTDGTTTAKTFTCTIKPLTVTTNLACNNKIYDGNANANCTITVTNNQGGDTISVGGSCTFNNANVGTNKPISCNNLTITGTNGSNYTTTGTTVTGTGSINNAKLTFDANGGTLNGTSPLYIRKGQTGVFTGLNNSTAGAIPTATRTGYVFNGWQSPGGVKIINADKTLVPNIAGWVNTNGTWLLTSNQTLTAIWTNGIYNVTLDKQYGTGGTNTIYEKYNVAYYLGYDGSAVSNYMTAGQNPVVPPTRVGYTFAGYYTAVEGGTRYIDYNGYINTSANATQFSSNGSLYAHWSPKVLTITLNKQGGTGGTNTIYEKYNVAYYLNYDGSAVSNYMTAGQNPVVTPTKAGYTFAGYYTAIEGGTKYIDANGKITANADITQFSSNGTLYAHWTDATAPTIIINHTGSALTATITDADSGVVAYAINDRNEALPANSSEWITVTNTSSYNVPSTAHTSGARYVHAKDAAGNISRRYTTVASINMKKNGTNTRTISVTNPGFTCESTNTTLATCSLTKNESDYTLVITSKTSNGTPKIKVKTSDGSTYITYNVNIDATAPTPTIAGGTALKTATQTVTLKCSDDTGVTAYYFGTTNPTSVDSITTTTSLSSLTGSGLSQDITASGTYYLACRDAVGNFTTTSIVMRKYQVQNVLLALAGTAGTYTSANYATSGSTATYYIKDGTAITLANVYTTTAATGTFLGHTVAAPSDTAQTPSKTAPTVTNNTTKYYMWFNRTTFTVTLNAGKGGSLKADRVNLAGTATAPAEGSSTITVRYGESVKATANPSTGYSLSAFSGGYISGSTSPTTGAAITENKTITAAFTPNVYAVALDGQSGTGGTSTIYEKYNTGFYLNYTNNAVSNYMSPSQNGITIPTRSGYSYIGHFTSTNGNGNQYINTNGRILSGVSTTKFTNNSGVLYAYWTKDNYQVGSKKYPTLETAYNACTSYFSEGVTCTIKVIASNTDSSRIVVEEGNSVTINTNGLTVTKTTTSIVNKGTLTLTGTGTITASAVHTINNSNGGELIVNGPTVKTTATATYYPVYNDGGNFTLTSGTISSTSTAGVYLGNVTINGGTISLTNNNIINVRAVNTSGSVTMTGGTITISRTNTSTDNTTSYTTIGINKTGTEPLVITGGTINTNCNLTKAGTSNNGCYGITVNSTAAGNTISGVTINATSTGDSASYGMNLSANSTVELGNGNTVTSTNMGILAYGNVTFAPVTSSTYTGTNSYGLYIASANATVTIGDGNNITGTSAINMTSATTSGSLTINGGTITGTSNYAIQNASTSPIKITGGLLTSPKYVIYNSSTGRLQIGENDGSVSIENPRLIRTAIPTGVVGFETKVTIYNKNNGTNNTTYIYDGRFDYRDIGQNVIPNTVGSAALDNVNQVLPTNYVFNNFSTYDGNSQTELYSYSYLVVDTENVPSVSAEIEKALTYQQSKKAKIILSASGTRKLATGTYTVKYKAVPKGTTAPTCSEMANSTTITVSTATPTASKEVTGVGAGFTGEYMLYVCNTTAISDTSGGSLPANTLKQTQLFRVDNTPPTTTYTPSGTQVTGTGSTRLPGYVAGNFKIIATCTDAHSGPSELKNVSSGSTAKNTGSSSSISLSTRFNSYTSAANMSTTCTDKAGNVATTTSPDYIVYRKFQLNYSKNGSGSISKSSETAQYLLANDTAHDGGHKYTLPTISRTAVGSEVRVFGWNTSSTSKSAIWYNVSKQYIVSNGQTATWNDTIQVDVYYGSGTHTLSKVYADNGNYAAIRTLYAISYDTIPSEPFSLEDGYSKYYQPGSGLPGHMSAGEEPTNDTNIELAEADGDSDDTKARIFNTRRSIYASKGICGATFGVNSSAALYNGSTLIQRDTRLDIITVPLGNFTAGNWRCEAW